MRSIRIPRSNAISDAVLGTAHLYGLVGEQDSDALIQAALEVGFTCIDTAPSYGYGRSEVAVARAVRAHSGAVRVTTKLGIAAVPAPGRGVRIAKAAARRLPGAVQRRLRGGAGDRSAEQGRFGLAEVRTSVEQSLRRLPRVDRLLLHEVRPDDLSEELLAQLQRYLRGGDVAQIGVATGNSVTAACLTRAPDVLTTANIAIGPFADAVDVTAAGGGRPAVEWVGHGVFGAGGADLRRIERALRADDTLAASWQARTAGTAWSSPRGLADALLARAVAQHRPAGVILATSRTDRLTQMHSLLVEDCPLPESIRSLLDELCLSAKPS